MLTFPRCEDPCLCTRIIGEYLEMPGLRLTLPQAQRLWNTDARTCCNVLDSLVEAGFLRKTISGYARADEGRYAA